MRSGAVRSGIAERLDRLADAFEFHGLHVRSNLLPGASAAELDAVEQELAVHLPQAFREVYGWSAGCIDPERDPSLMFRDNTFMPLAQIVTCRREVVETYADPLGATTGPDSYGIDLATTAPFAAFMGSVYLVACGSRRLVPDSPHPVIGAFHDVDVYFLSIEAMIETCIEWVEQPDYNPYGTAPNEVEIWHKHNPGVFV